MSLLQQLFRFLSIRCQEIARTFVQAVGGKKKTHTLHTLTTLSKKYTHPPTHAMHTSSSCNEWAVISLSGSQHAACAAMHLLDGEGAKQQLFSVICLINRKWAQGSCNYTTFRKAEMKIKKQPAEPKDWDARGDVDWHLNSDDELKLAGIQSWIGGERCHERAISKQGTILSNETSCTS